MKCLVFIILSLILSLNLKAQLPIVNQDSLKVPLVKSENSTKSTGAGSSSVGIAPVSMPIMPSAHASSLVRAATASPNLYTGAVNVSIPLYTLPAQGMNIPIGLVYQSNGVKVNDKNGPLGMTWALQGGGAVTRIVKGYPDEFKGEIKQKIYKQVDLNFFDKSFEIHDDKALEVVGKWYAPNDPDMSNMMYNDDDPIKAFKNYIEEYSKNDEIHDMFRDKFIFSGPGISGYFFIRPKLTDNDLFDVYICSDRKLSIELKFNKLLRVMEGFTITSENGTLYEFGMARAYREEQSYQIENTKINTIQKKISNIGYNLNSELPIIKKTISKTILATPYQSVWYLNQISTPYNADVISYRYKNCGDTEELQGNSVTLEMDDVYINSISYENGKNRIYSPNNKEDIKQSYSFSKIITTTHARKQLVEISSSIQKLQFEYSENNTITSLTIGNANSPVKSFNFSYLTSNSRIPEPDDTVTFTDCLDGKYKEFSFDTGLGGKLENDNLKQRYFLTGISEINSKKTDSVNLFLFEYNTPDFLPQRCSKYQNPFGFYRKYSNFKENFILDKYNTWVNRYESGNRKLQYKIMSINGPSPDWVHRTSSPEIGMLTKYKNATGAFTNFVYQSKDQGAFLTQRFITDGNDTLQMDSINYHYESAQKPYGIYAFEYRAGYEKRGYNIWCGTEAAFTQGAYFEFEKVTSYNRYGKTEYTFTSPNTIDENNKRIYDNQRAKVYYYDSLSDQIKKTTKRDVGKPSNLSILRGKALQIISYNLMNDIVFKKNYKYEIKQVSSIDSYSISANNKDINDFNVYIARNDLSHYYLRPTEVLTTRFVNKDTSQNVISKTEYLRYLGDSSYNSGDKLVYQPTEIRKVNLLNGDTILSKIEIEKFGRSGSKPRYLINKQIILKNGRPLSGSEIEFDESSRLPKQIKTYVDGKYEGIKYFDVFDDKGRVLGTHGRNDIHMAYRYKEGRFELMAENATHEQIQTGSAEDLRKKLPEARIASIEYSPEGFIKTKNDANGLSLSYDYDSFGRLKLVSDFDQNALAAYDYQYGKVGQVVNEKKLGIGEMQIGLSFVVGGYTEITSKGMSTKGKNYISSYTFRKEGALFQERNKSGKVFKSIEYQDGLGRPIQQIALNTLPGEYSLVKGFEYDSLGRQSTQYRSLPMLTNDAYKDSWKSYLKSAYQTTYKSESLYDSYNRLSKQGGFGENYALNAHASNYSYGMNKSGIPSYSIKQGFEEFTSKNYKAKTLFRNSVYFEGITQVTYKNMDGQLVRKAVVKGHVTSDPSYESALITDYVYDDYGNLRAILPPQAKGDINQEKFVYQFHYDGRGRLIKKKIPGAGSIELKYDDLDRPINETDAIGNTSYVKYDKFSRPIETGILVCNAAGEKTQELAMQKSYYDNYDFEFAKAHPASFTNALMNKGRRTGSETKVLGEDIWIKSVNYYDKRGRLIEVISQNNTGGIDQLKNSFDFEGKMLNSVLTKNYNGKEWTIEREYSYGKTGELLDVSHRIDDNRKVLLNSFTYKPDGAVSEKRMHNGRIKNRYHYDELDRMIKMSTEKHFSLELAFDSKLEGVQNTPYYDGRISAMAWQTNGQDRLTYSFDYDVYKNLKAANSSDHDYIANYSYNKNGNIEELQRFDTLGLFQSFIYKYKGNQLDSLKRNNTEQVEVWPGDANNDDTVDVDDLLDVGYNYELKVRPRDKRSDEWMAWWVNRRKGDMTVFSDSNGDGIINETDTLAIRQNMLKTHPVSQINKNNTFGYRYDANGNMILDEYKNIEIHYNHLNLPDTITAFGQGKIVNVYLADGSLLQRKVFNTEGEEIDKLDYQGEFLFQQDRLSKIFTEEGYVSPSESNNKKLIYYYVVSDHLGHTRVVLDEDENVVQTAAYYPYGLPITDLSSETKYNYLYTGKEFVGDFGLNWYDHHARQYDAEIGRWWAIDPALQAASPYLAMGNNPMMYVDADGRTWKIFKPFVKAWNGLWDAANNFAKWAYKNGIPSFNLGITSNTQGQIQPVGDINGYPLFDNESQYEVASQNAVDAINDARGDYFSQQAYSANYDQFLDNKLMQITSNELNSFLSTAGNWNTGAGALSIVLSEEFYSQSNHVLKWAKNAKQNGLYVLRSAIELTKEYQASMRAVGKGFKTFAGRSYWTGIFIDSYSFAVDPSLQQGQRSALGVSYGTLSYFFPPTMPYGIMITVLGPEPIKSSWEHQIKLYQNYNIPPKGWMH